MGEPEDFVICRECGKHFGQITWVHLLKHNITVEQYRHKYPNAPIVPPRPKKKKIIRQIMGKEGVNYVVCMECDKRFEAITSSHLSNKHNMSTEEYRCKYPDAPFYSRVRIRKFVESKKQCRKQLDLQGVEPKDFVICRICGKRLRVIHAHLRIHGINLKEYKEMYPQAPNMSTYHKNRIKDGVIKFCEAIGTRRYVLQGTEPEDYVVCRICNERFRVFKKAHFKSQKCLEEQRKKNVFINTLEEYRIVFPDAYTACLSTILQLKDSLRGKLCWFKDLPNTDSRVMRMRKTQGETMRDKYASGELVVWSKGRTKETHPSIMKMANSRVGEDNPMYGKRPWNYGLTAETDDRLAEAGRKGGEKRRGVPRSDEAKRNVGEGGRRRWAAYTEEERKEMIYKLRIKSRPNKTEIIIEEMVKPLGFVYNKRVTCSGYSKILGRVRSIIVDFVHVKYPMILQYDGWGGHGPSNSRLPRNVTELDSERDKICSDNDLYTICILTSDLNKGREYVISKVRKESSKVGFQL